MRNRPATALLVTILTTLARTAPAAETVSHVVARGHTLDAIANRYHVSKQAIIEANHLTDPKHLKIGEVLTIPVKPKDPSGKSKGKPVTYAARSKTPGVVHATRAATTENFTIRVRDRRSKVSPVAVKSFETLMRSSGNLKHPIDPRLIALAAVVSDHFGGRKLEVVSGFRPFTSTQFNPHSNHNLGRALDFRVQGVPNEILRDFCKTLKNVGCGYYPNSVFVHMDVRDQSVAWIDYSKPGESPRYDSAASQKAADEGTSDVHDGTPSTAEPEPTLSGGEPGPAPAPAPTAPAAPPPATSGAFAPTTPTPAPAPTSGSPLTQAGGAPNPAANAERAP